MPFQFTCETCGKPFTRRKSRPARFCSNTCHFASRSPVLRRTFTCQNCGQPFEDYQREGKTRTHCSRACAGQARTRENLQRILANYTIDPASGCWVYQGTAGEEGYCLVKVSQRSLPVHRVFYEHHVGPIPSGMHLDHVKARGCVHRNCVNPAHLEPVTPRENVRRSNAPRKNNRCKRGHEMTPENSWVKRSVRGWTWTQCKACARITRAIKSSQEL